MHGIGIYIYGVADCQEISRIHIQKNPNFSYMFFHTENITVRGPVTFFSPLYTFPLIFILCVTRFVEVPNWAGRASPLSYPF